MHTPPSEPRGSRRANTRPLEVAASIVLTAGLLSSAAPAAQAAVAASASVGGSPAPVALPQSAAAVEHPALERTVTATFTPGAPTTDGSPRNIEISYAVHLKNTGDVPLNVFLDGYREPNDAPTTLAVGESKDLEGGIDYVVASEIASGFWPYTTTGAAYTPQGTRIDAGIYARVPVPRGALTPTPSQTATPSPSQPATPSTRALGPSTAQAGIDPAVTVTIAGKFVTEPGEPVKEGTPVEFTYTVKNTGGVDLTDVLGRKLAVGESFLLTTTKAVVTAQNIKDGYVAAESKAVRGTLPDRSRVVVSPAFEYKLPIPEKPPIPAETPDLDVKVTGTFQVKEGEPVVAGTKVKWTAALTNTGNVDLRDVRVADSETLAVLPVGKTGEVHYESTVTERDVFNHSIFIAAPATATTPAGTEYSKQTLGTLAIPAVTPVPIEPTPAPVGPVHPAPLGPDAKPTPAPFAGAAARPATEITTSTGTAAPAASASTRSTAGHLASTGSDAGAALPAAGVLALLGAVGVFLGRRRRQTGTASE